MNASYETPRAVALVKAFSSTRHRANAIHLLDDGNHLRPESHKALLALLPPEESASLADSLIASLQERTTGWRGVSHHIIDWDGDPVSGYILEFIQHN